MVLDRLRARRGRAQDVNLRSAPQLLEYEAIVRRIAHAGPERILDWGCGYGQITDLLVKQGLAVDAFDYGGPEAPNAHVPLERFPPLRAFLSSEPVALPYASDTFDAVLSCGVLEHVSDPDGSLEEIRRVLRPGGTLFCFKLPNRFSYLERIAKSAGLYYHGQLPFDRVYTLRSARGLLERHGYELREIRYANMLPLTLNREMSDRAASLIWRCNQAVARVPAVNALSTNIELVAQAS